MDFFIIFTLLPILFFAKPRVAFIVQTLSSLSLIVFSIIHLINHDYLTFILFNSLINGADFPIRLDALSLLFVIIISTISAAVSIYSINYLYDEDYHHKRLFAFIYTTFIASLIFVVTSFNAISFLIFWEIMSVLSFFMVIYSYKNEENKKGGFIYLFMTHLGTAFITLAFILMYKNSGSFDFNDWIHLSLSNTTKFWVFLFVLIGFGTKAGMFPIHVWLPKAHPVAPSNISALMSGVMIKTAIYMFVRFYFYFLNDIPWWYGFIVLIIGSFSALFGVMYALAQHDLKKLLAYHSIENIGIIMMGLGSAMLFFYAKLNILAAFALLAALFHTYNHAIFKSLLFLGAGATLLKTHTKDMEKYGGLIKLMPFTTLFFLIGSISISALPPFNGFVSEWLTYQSLLLNNNINIELVKIFVPIFASMLALTGAFAAACFVKVIGVSFLGKPKSQNSKKASEVRFYMLFGMGILASLCILFGLFPNIVIKMVSPVSMLLLNVNIASFASSKSLFISTPNFSFGHITTLGLALSFIAVLAILYLLVKKFANTQTRITPTWACGQIKENVNAQYSASGFSQPVRRVFAFFYNPKEGVKKVEQKSKYFFPKKDYIATTTDGIETLYQLISKAIINISDYLLKKIENGSIHIYLLYIFLTSIAFLIYAIQGDF